MKSLEFNKPGLKVVLPGRDFFFLSEPTTFPICYHRIDLDSLDIITFRIRFKHLIKLYIA